MAETEATEPRTGPDDKELEEIIKLTWGDQARQDIFQRWTQGFSFSDDEPTALVQFEGGPCAVLAPMQAYILKYIVNNKSANDDWKKAEVEEQNHLLCKAACDILCQATEGCDILKFVHIDDTAVCLEHSRFHSMLKVEQVNKDSIETFFNDHISFLRNTFGVLLFLYTVMRSKGLVKLKEEIMDLDVALIDKEFGYGSQSLINMMITGQAVSNVFNNDQVVAGLKLQGIEKQSEVGFLTLLEHLRYLQVGTYLKNPCNPIWVLGSDTHLTVLFSFDQNLVSKETQADIARRTFKLFDQDGNNFISTQHLKPLLEKLDLVSDDEYVNLMSTKLDSEGLGIILMPSFMEEFFSEQETRTPDVFVLFHYNGQPRSNSNSKVTYLEGNAIIQESDVICISEDNNLQSCLQSKWSSIEIQWKGNVTPSIN
ncbi:ubiquitin carboxyl-terminal hydrolase MINDY-3 [Acyrthosiphon pisum]|uniref:Ubiquitin carboxyl-terminal hydrolase MINDY n=1 Tax=Acyrthosiphon pisum TaxID=7029 RepID=A0A8R2B872_ACYPI|nr:ubiquitin carboxyl-terminal hydrolase MINDY-3 [Acyrthosiphon pisum]XP_008185838.1 ubiquitin carboxyl-terminal hydrolase MINDY-3 [Acyrthosiphon pisum]XP_029345367.1 ubiquitin carboxyl-terminal hydrolase MINDY-3 [Acyrthosiphon pisum]|eukprot:XP_008185837.1 PREDICTED: protein FAM188A [Acyrthosiphon pisum]